MQCHLSPNVLFRAVVGSWACLFQLFKLVALTLDSIHLNKHQNDSVDDNSIKIYRKVCKV